VLRNYYHTVVPGRQDIRYQASVVISIQQHNVVSILSIDELDELCAEMNEYDIKMAVCDVD